MTPDRKQYALNAASGWLVQFSTAIVGFVLMPYAIWRLGAKEYGIYQIACSALVFLGFLQLGMGPTLVRFFAQAFSKQDQEEIRRVGSTAQLILSGVGLLGAILSLVLIPVFKCFYEIPADLDGTTTGMLFCLAFSFLVSMISIAPQGMIYGANRYDLANLFEIISNFLRLGFVVVAFELLSPSLFLMGFSTLAAQVCRLVFFLITGARIIGKPSIFSFHAVERKSARSLLGFSMLNLTNSIAATLVFQGPALVIGKVLGQEMVTAFAPALLISQSAQGFLGRITSPLVPLAGRDRTEKSGANLGKWAIDAGQVTAFFGFALVVPLVAYGNEIIRLWLGGSMAWTWSLIAIMVTGVAISQVQAANYHLALGGGCIRPTVFSQVLMAVVVLAGTIGGTIRFGWGPFEVVCLIGFCIFIRNTFYLAYAYSKQFSYEYLPYLNQVYAKIAAVSFGVIGVGLLLKQVAPFSGLIILMLQISGMMLIYTLVCWKFYLPETAKAMVREFWTASKIPAAVSHFWKY